MAIQRVVSVANRILGGVLSYLRADSNVRSLLRLALQHDETRRGEQIVNLAMGDQTREQIKGCHSDMNFEFIPIYWSFSVIHGIRRSTSLHFVPDSNTTIQNRNDEKGDSIIAPCSTVMLCNYS